MIYPAPKIETDLIAIPDSTTVFAIGDVHGQADAFHSMLVHIKNIDTGSNKRILVHTGDIADRGPKNLKAIEYLLDAQKLTNTDEVYLLPGNHELMYLDAFEDQLCCDNWLNNGGWKVLREMRAASPENTLADLHDDILDLCKWKTLIQSMPSHFKIGNVIFVHAGIAPYLDTIEQLAVSQSEHRYTKAHWAWIRDDFLCHEGGFKGDIIVHGHTPALRHNHPIDTTAVALMDLLDTHNRINIDAGAAHSPQVGGVMIENGSYQILIAT
jgi:serine/threonine protein phosphatase 1